MYDVRCFASINQAKWQLRDKYLFLFYSAIIADGSIYFRALTRNEIEERKRNLKNVHSVNESKKKNHVIS